MPYIPYLPYIPNIPYFPNMPYQTDHTHHTYPTYHTTPPPHHRGGRGTVPHPTTPQGGGGGRSHMGPVYGTHPMGVAGPGAYIYMYIYIYIYVYIYMYIYMYIYNICICIYIYTILYNYIHYVHCRYGYIICRNSIVVQAWKKMFWRHMLCPKHHGCFMIWWRMNPNSDCNYHHNTWVDSCWLMLTLIEWG